MTKRHWGSSLGKFEKHALTSEINVTPLVDVCLVLLIIFMVVTPMLQKGVPVNLPVTSDPKKTPDTEKQLHIPLHSAGTRYLIHNAVLPADELPQLISSHQHR